MFNKLSRVAQYMFSACVSHNIPLQSKEIKEDTFSSETISNEIEYNTFNKKYYFKSNEDMNPEIQYLITAEKVILDKDSNNPTIIGIFQGIFIPKEAPAVVLPITVFARIKHLEGDVETKITIFEPSGNELESLTLKGKVDKALQIRAIFSLVTFSKEGVHKIRITVNGKELPSNDDHSILVKKL